ncbi:MAG: hypothetical protein JRG71_11970 [Deltaproteobacteria bacterium]|nr:hypothetical protein [Deltaproteobacteria bacterium]
MSRQLNLRVNDEFANQLERLSKKMGRSMASVLEAVAGQAIETAEADIQFEAQALKAWEDYELTGVHVSSDDIDSMFDSALTKAQRVAKGLR